MSSASVSIQKTTSLFLLGTLLSCQLELLSADAESTLPTGVQSDGMYANTLLPQAGYFPTQSETPLLRGPANARDYRGQSGAMGPDLQMQSATGMFPYKDQDGNVYDRNPNLFRNMDHLLGFLTPNDAWTMESNEVRHTALTLDANSGILTRTFSPDLAMVKMGPLFFDLLWVGGGVVWSDYNGPQTFAPGKGDGVVSYVGMGFRGLLRITDTIFLSAAGSLYYLPQVNRLAFGLGYGNQNSLSVDLYFSDTWGQWDVNFSNSFSGRPGLNFFSSSGRSAIDSAGRYWFGLQQNNGNQFASNSSAFFSNTVGFSASRLVFGRAWRFWSTIQHGDFWRTFNFTNHSQREQLSLVLGYEGSIIPFAPRLSYNAYSFDQFKSLYHQFGLGLTGRITENVNWTGYAGYLFSTGASATKANSFLWNVGLAHNLTSKTNQNINVGENLLVNTYSNDALTARYINYSLSHSFARKLQLGIFAQISDRQSYISRASGTYLTSSTAGGGATLNYQPLDFTSISASIVHSESLKPTGVMDQWITQLGITQQLSMRMTGTVTYQYQENNVQNGFTEHMIMLGLRRYF